MVARRARPATRAAGDRVREPRRHPEPRRRRAADPRPASVSTSRRWATPRSPDRAIAARDVLRAGGERRAIQMNCSGKHAGMLATCVVNGWSTDDYLDLTHPLQRAITTTVEQLAGEVIHVGVDGCGAPAHVLPFAAWRRPSPRSPLVANAVWQAMTTHPEMVGGPTATSPS